ncbi:hypothetical protein [Actinomadura nitritigenes]|nr:hypothetical protein [Actinomadura nitritigenes]
MRTSARTGLAVAVAGAAGGLTLLAGGAAIAATAPHRAEATQQTPPAKICRYEVTASTLTVRTGPGVNYDPVPPPLYRAAHIGADCTSSHGGWVQVWQGVQEDQMGMWVSAAYLKPIRALGGAEAGAGGTSAAANPMLAGAGLGAIALGGGVAVAARRRRAQGAA